MGDLRNKFRKDQETERVRRMQARYAAPSGTPFVPVCDGCGLKGLNNPSPKGFGFLRIYAVTGGWQEPGNSIARIAWRLTPGRSHMATEPDWSTPGTLDGLPVRHWKRRTGYTERGTVAQLVMRWLALPWNIKTECSLGWGPNAAGQHGAMGSSEIGSYVRRHGCRPRWRRASGPATPEEIEAMFAKPGCGKVRDWDQGTARHDRCPVVQNCASGTTVIVCRLLRMKQSGVAPVPSISGLGLRLRDGLVSSAGHCVSLEGERGESSLNTQRCATCRMVQVRPVWSDDRRRIVRRRRRACPLTWTSPHPAGKSWAVNRARRPVSD